MLYGLSSPKVLHLDYLFKDSEQRKCERKSLAGLAI